MSPESLPYTVLMLLLELGLGSLVTVLIFDARKMVTQGYVQTGAVIVVSCAILALWSATGRPPTPDVDGYALRGDLLGPLKTVLLAFTAVAGVYAAAAFAGQHRAGLVTGVATAVIGLVATALLARLVGDPAWSYLGLLLSMCASALVLGGALMAMSWGHWYLTNSGLPKEPLEQMSLLVVGALAFQAILVVLGAVLAPREVPLGEVSIGVGLIANPAFWLRVGVGVLFPAALSLLAWQAARIRGMMSATGLLYIATGCVLAGEVLARGLLFATGLVL